MIKLNIQFAWKEFIALILALFMLFEITGVEVWAQEGSFEARKAKYEEMRIVIGDDKYTKLKEEEVADRILSSPYASPEITEIAQSYKDNLLLYKIWMIANVAVPVLYWGTLWGASYFTRIPSKNAETLVGVGAVFSILSGVSSAIAGTNTPTLPVTVAQSYNEDLRKELNLTEVDIAGL